MISKAVVFSLTLFFSLVALSTAHAAVWETTNQWSEKWEDDYAKWVHGNWTTTFFETPGTPYTGLERDCADVVYSMRLIYASLNGLPFAMKDSSGGRHPVTNEMKRWDKLSQSARIRNFLVLVMELGSTFTLPHDTVPTFINRTWVKPGALFVTDQKSHHSLSLKTLSETGIPTWILSTRPPQVHALQKIGYLSEGFSFPNGIRPETGAGIRIFREPQDLQKASWSVRGWSEEQYRFPAGKWVATVKSHLALKKELSRDELNRVMASTCEAATERVEVVNAGVKVLNSMGADKCMNASQYDDYSTPNKDQRLHDSYDELKAAYLDAKKSGENVDPKLMAQVEDVLFHDVQNLSQVSNPFCLVKFSANKSMTLGELRRRSIGKLLSSNPNDPLEMRWGEVSGPSPRSQHCPNY